MHLEKATEGRELLESGTKIEGAGESNRKYPNVG